MKLYEINNEIEKIINEAVDENGEINSEYEEKLDQLQMEKEKKITDIGCLIKSWDYEVETIQTEIQKLQQRKKAIENRKEWLKEYLIRYADTTRNYKDGRIVISWRESERIEVEDMTKLNPRFIRVKEIKEADKIAIKEAIKEGEDVPGAKLIKNMNVIIK